MQPLSIVFHTYLKAFSCLAILVIGGIAFSASVGAIERTKIYHVNCPGAGSTIGVVMVSDYFDISRTKNKAYISTEEVLH